ncbi:5-hydroxytryptamine receptor 1D isoform X2 [Betta splendens]|nr:5-hydroxytryptamine receptor 1D isoform X2 [Betta splendens]
MNLAVSDLLVGVGVMPFVALSVLNQQWVNCTDLCLYVGYTSSVYCTASVLSLAAIALDRYYSIVDCLRYSSRCTLWRTSAVVLWIWLQALATSCGPLLGWSSISYVVPMYSCSVNWAGSPSYTAFMAALTYLIPAVVILFCYINIVKVARSHARRIHTLEDSVQRSRNLNSGFTPGNRAHHGHCPSRLVYHVSGQFVSDVSGDEGRYISVVLPDSAAEQSSSASRRLFSLPAQGAPQQHHSHHGLVRLFLVISAFFLCWTPFISVALIQATEAAVSGQSSLVPPSAVTFSYWLVLLNSDINPLLYALLSKRFQGALQGLGQKISERLGSAVGRAAEARVEGCDSRLASTRPGPRSSSGSSTSDDPKYSPSIFTVSAAFRRHCEEHLCHHETPSSPSGGESRVHCLQVPPQPQERSRLPFSALAKDSQATFFYGQITVRVERDVVTDVVSLTSTDVAKFSHTV